MSDDYRLPWTICGCNDHKHRHDLICNQLRDSMGYPVSDVLVAKRLEQQERESEALRAQVAGLKAALTEISQARTGWVDDSVCPCSECEEMQGIAKAALAETPR